VLTSATATIHREQSQLSSRAKLTYRNERVVVITSDWTGDYRLGQVDLCGGPRSVPEPVSSPLRSAAQPPGRPTPPAVDRNPPSFLLLTQADETHPSHR